MLEEIYYLTSLSRQGAIIVLAGVRSTSGETMKNYIQQQCRVGAQRDKDRIMIEDLANITLQTLAYIVTWVAGTTLPHSVTKKYLDLDQKCMQPTLFNWCEGTLANVREQLTNMKRGKIKKFVYGSLLVNFFFEKILVMGPMSLDYVVYPPPTEPWMVKW